jgi:serine/threonine protein kinase
MRIFRRADFPQEAVLEILRAHAWQVENARSSLLKDTPARRISIVSTGVALMPRDYIVKEEIHHGLRDNLTRLLGFSHSRRAWKNAHALRMSDISAPEAFALVEEEPGKQATNSSFVIFQRESGAIPLDKFVLTYVAELPRSDVVPRRTFVRQLARFIAGLHDRGIFHGDLKANNVLVGRREGGDFVFSLLDLDRIRIVEKVPETLRVRNLAQLNASIPGALTRADRMAGFRAYWRCWAGTRQATRRIVGAVMEITRLRAHVWPGVKK